MAFALQAAWQPSKLAPALLSCYCSLKQIQTCEFASAYESIWIRQPSWLEPDMNSQTIVLIAPFDDKGNVLLLKRDDDKHCGGLWSFPGGKVEAGESPQAAAVRELKEETGLDATAWQSICNQSFEYPDRLLHFELFSCVCLDLSSLDTESVHVWSAIDTLTDYPMPAANDPFIKALQTRGS